MTNDVRDLLKFIQIKALFPAIAFIVLLSIIWDVYLTKRIIYYVKIYKDCLRKAKTDPFGISIEEARYYKIEIIKQTSLLIINATEFVTILAYGIGACRIDINHTFGGYFLSGITTSHNCSLVLHLQTFDMKLLHANPLFSILVAIGQVGLIFSIAFGICLVRYLHIVYHEMSINYFKFVKRFLIITSLIGIFLVITGSVPQLILIEKLVEPIILFIYFCIWVKSNMTFYKTLRWRSIEYRIRGWSDWTVRRSVINYRQFMIFMSCMGIVTACFLLADLITQYFFLISAAIYDGPCLFNRFYGTAFYKPLLTTQQQISAIKLTNEILSYIATFLIFTASVLLGLEYILASFLFFGSIFWSKLKTRFYKVRTRFTPNLDEPLIFHPED